MNFRCPMVVALAALALSAGTGCAGTGAAGRGRSAQTAAERVAALHRMLAREEAPAPTRQVSLLGGLATAELESTATPRPECKTDEAGERACTVVAELGKDEDGTPSNVVCNVASDFSAFGVQLKAFLGESKLDETPVLHTTAVGEGFSVMFSANTVREDDATVYVGTAKVATLYAHGYMATCMDAQAGGRKTFDRVVTRFFRTLKFKPNPQRNALFAAGATVRSGERTTGFRFQTITRRGHDEPGFLELAAYFHLETDGKTWSVRDGVSAVERDAQGGIEKMKNLFWADGHGPAVLSAKPGEERRFRLKLEMGAKTSGVESTPKAPLNTELWGAPELLKVSSGSAPSYRYSFLDVNDSDPSFHYVTLTRREPGVLYEEQEALAPAHDGSALDSKDELHVNARGLVVKEVSSKSVTELVHTWGELPLPGAGEKSVERKSKVR